jgi:hypothetical protein
VIDAVVIVAAPSAVVVVVVAGGSSSSPLIVTKVQTIRRPALIAVAATRASESQDVDVAAAAGTKQA